MQLQRSNVRGISDETVSHGISKIPEEIVFLVIFRSLRARGMSCNREGLSYESTSYK